MTEALSLAVAPPLSSYRHRFHVALDGNGLNGLEGMAGVCLFLYNPDAGTYAYKIRYFDGLAAGHAVSLNPSGKVGFLGNAGQHLLLYNALTLDEIRRVSTLRYEGVPSSLQGSTHAAWMSDQEYISSTDRWMLRTREDAAKRATWVSSIFSRSR